MGLFRLNEDVLLEYKKALAKRREKAVKNLDIANHDSKMIDTKDTEKKINNDFAKNKHFQRMNIRNAKAMARNNVHYKDNRSVKAGGQALPTKNNIRHLDIGKDYDKSGIFDHEVGHTYQMADAYRKSGTKGLFKVLGTEARLTTDKHTKNLFTGASKNLEKDVDKSGYFKSSLEHNANKFADQGNSKEVSKERKNIVNTYLKGTARARQLNSKNSGLKNAQDQSRLAQTPRNITKK